MPKKIYDVVPPKLAKKIEKDVKEFLEEENKKPKRRMQYKREGRSVWLPVSIGVVIVVVLIGGYLFFKLPKATIQIWPKVDILSFQQTITADKSADMTDIEEFIIPAKYFESTKTLSEEFPATGNATDEGRASGVITVYNKYDPPAPLTLKAGTRFLSDSGKLFTADQKVVIPAAKKSGGKITPGSVQVKVTAAEGGDSYNIPASNFSVPGLKGTAYYYSVYAESDGPMSGGYAGEIKKVTNSDIQDAEDSLVEKLTSEAVLDMENQISSDYIILDDAIFSEILDSGTETKSGAVTDNFTYEATIKVTALAFKKSDVEEFAKKYIISQMPDGKTFLDSSLKTDYSATDVDISKGKVVLDLDFSAGIYQSIDKNSMSLSLVGKNSSQINEAVSAKLGDQLSRLEIKFWPFWVTKSPKSQKAVNVILKFE